MPYSPTFLTQVKSGNVHDISATSASITGHFAKPIRYPADDTSVKPTKNFETQVPSFANNQQLDVLLNKDVAVIGAKNPNAGPSVLVQLLVGFGPTLLFLLLIFFAFRAMARGAAAPAG